MGIEQLIISIGAILLAARLFGFAFRFLGQPRVIGEMIAGIMLGPSVLGLLLPAVFARVFPAPAMTTLTALSQLGLLLFMFAVGLEVDLGRILKQRAAVILTSNASILVPLALGVALASFLYPELAGQGVAFSSFALFMGTAMSITAFPVLARILKERDILSTELGAIAISCAAVDDVTAWILLAILTAMVRAAHTSPHLLITLFGLIGFSAIMLIPVRQAILFLQRRYKNESGGGSFFALILLMLAASWTTERLGIHALFGAFVAGLIVPKDRELAAKTRQSIESVTLAFLIPIFFALTGLRTRIDLLKGGHLWGYAGAIIVIAVAGKLLGAALASRGVGMSWHHSLALGILMNTRGLVELVVLNAGLELGILSPTLFTMMVIMALVTTFMTTPLLGMLKVTALSEGSTSA